MKDTNKVFDNNESSEKLLENIIFDEYHYKFSGNLKFIIKGIELETLNPVMARYIFGKNPCWIAI